MHNPYLFTVLRYIAWNDQHDLHQYINFDDGPPTHLNECPDNIIRPTVADWNRRRRYSPNVFGNRFLRHPCSRLGEEFVIYGVIGRGSK